MEEDEDAIKELFKLDEEAVPALVHTLGNKKLRVHAAKALAYMRTSRGLEALRGAIPVEKDKEWRSLMSAYLAGALVKGPSKRDLDFLSSCIARYQEEDESFQAISAALALGMMRTDSALKILHRAQDLDEERIPNHEIAKAIRWIEKSAAVAFSPAPPGLSAEEQIKKIILDNAFYAEGEKDKMSIEDFTFNRKKDRALVSIKISHSPKAARGYDLVLKKENGMWGIVGIWYAWIA